MNFTLTVNGDSPAELLEALTQLGGMTINVNTSPNGGVDRSRVPQAHFSPAAPERACAAAGQAQSTDFRQGQKGRTETRRGPCGGHCKPYPHPCPECGCCCDLGIPCCPSAIPNNHYAGGCRHLHRQA